MLYVQHVCLGKMISQDWPKLLGPVLSLGTCSAGRHEPAKKLMTAINILLQVMNLKLLSGHELAH